VRSWEERSERWSQPWHGFLVLHVIDVIQGCYLSLLSVASLFLFKDQKIKQKTKTQKKRENVKVNPLFWFLNTIIFHEIETNSLQTLLITNLFLYYPSIIYFYSIFLIFSILILSFLLFFSSF